MLEELLGQILTWASTYPIVSTILMVVGVLRVVIKPLMSLLNAYVLATPSPSDNEWLRGFQEGKVYSIIIYVLDWLGSVKIPVADKDQIQHPIKK